MPSAPAFDAAFRARLRELLIWRRDVRRYRADPLLKGSVEKLLELACLAPSVTASFGSRTSDADGRLVCA
jgi:5,6-dimethylbenzimidazole synthase